MTKVKEGPLGARKPHEPSRMRMHGLVTVDDILQAFVGRVARIESSTGTQLAIAQARAMKDSEGRRVGDYRPVSGEMFVHPGMNVDPWSAMDRAEQSMGREIGVIRCLDDLCGARHVNTRWVGALVGLHARAKSRTQGEIVVLVLRAYHEWATQSKERGLAEVHVTIQRLGGIEVDNAAELAQSFREGKDGNARKAAAKMYSDCLTALSEWVRTWNRKAR